MSRSLRQSKILDLIASMEICSQDDLMLELKRLHFDVNQSTISRDIKELGLIKVALDNGKSKYAYVDIEGEKQRVTSKYINLFKESVLSIAASENLIVVKTLSGSANSAASAIDKMGISGILGSVAGDDTLLIIAKSKDEVFHILDVLNSKLN